MFRKIIFTIIFFICTTSPLSADQTPKHDPDLPIDEMDRCSSDADCVPAPEVFTGCFHFCKDKECISARVCPAMNKNFKNFPNCFANLPCKPATGKPVCSHQRCVNAQ